MSDKPDLPPLREVIRQYGLRAEKKLGQNFLLDSNITDKIVRSAGDLGGVHAVEIGPGPGGLTRSILASKAASVTAIEFDQRAVTALQDLKRVYPDRLHIIHGDALEADLTALVPAPRAVIANLPYNIATPLTLGWLRQIRSNPENAFRSMTLMYQKEVAERLCAAPNTKAYGRLSVITGWLCAAKRVYDLPPSAFTPPPKVTSSVVHFTPRALPDNHPTFEQVEKLTALAFGQRRKMIRGPLKDYMAIIEALGIPETARAEELGIEQFLAIAKQT
ncbi:MAG: 16S rRNA (adenine(1518)-N(6)/adenine(1519)-N(6))-dimethyltransferase RsmA [Alphaproteobacteria bacterium]|nr:16S rRNA (adenine(1518)-N(6)/adenine(1519)-N(6))-dimethyltransferase RsmA [Alphaproteobacteria bacterium]MCD8526515.1 16S rRNA (adenine(1518)-N(6)/adenine(1519)-N(6))-dimethyltransferase RsmA [Alphaproteobacteria bacterium]MCD8570345.1 16S rRNA (adenine(1518)-N(6)/adenine(1519)-N(6))-dimethyltransferase RsmA [Alphaproteobacteria bacterium]